MKPGGNYRWVVCGLLFFSVAINYIDRLVIGILKAPLSEALGWSEVDYGNIAAAFSFAYAFGYLIGGRSMDRFGVKKGLPIFVLAWSIAATAHGLVALIGLEEKFSVRYPWFSWTEKGFVMMTLAMPMTAAGFMFARIALGLTEGANFPGAIKATAEWFPVKERAMATGLFNAGSNVGAILCPIGVPWMFQHLGWPATFYITGATGFIWVAVWWWIYEVPEKHKRLSPAELNYIKEGQPVTEERLPAMPWRKLIGYRSVWAFIVASILAGPAWGFYQFFLPDFLAKKFSTPKLTIVDVQNVAAFAGKLNQTNNSMAFYLRSQFSPETHTLLAAHQSGGSNDLQLSQVLVEDLNKVILSQARISTNHFSDVLLRKETAELLAKPAHTNTIARVNRMLLEDAYPAEISRMMNLQTIGWWTGAFFAIAAIGGVLGGWLAGKLLTKGWSLNAARKVSLLCCALAVVPVFLAPYASHVWVAVVIVGLAGSAHQGWSANLFSVISDTLPKQAISSAVGLGGFLCFFTGGFVNKITGNLLQSTGSYLPVFLYFSGMYLLSLLAIQLLVTKIGGAER
ncbi:MAG: MFS transporter [Verrucomicrobiota bacterium]